jgi:hypothetical protein
MRLLHLTVKPLRIAIFGSLLLGPALSTFSGQVFADTVSKETPPAGEKPAWDYWYTVTLNGKLHYQYYNEQVSFKKDKIFYQSKAWKKEDDFINEEQLGAFAENTPALTPLFYNFHTTYRASETVIDGTLKDGATLTFKVRKGTEELPIITKVYQKKAILSSFFPVWLGQRMADFKQGVAQTFVAILEDSIDTKFTAVDGSAKLEADDDYAKAHHAHKFSLTFGTKATWWVDDKGAALRIESQEQNSVIERSTREKAEKFLTSSK